MSEARPLVVVYQVGDGATFTAWNTVPVMAASKESFLSDFELALAAYDPDDGADAFLVGGELFKYRHFIGWSDQPGRVYDTAMPEVLTIEEWIEQAAGRSEFLAKEHRVNVVSDGMVHVG